MLCGVLVGAGCTTKRTMPAPLAATDRSIPFLAVDQPLEAPNGRVRDFVAGVIQLAPNEGRVLITERLIRGGANERPETIQAGLASGEMSGNWHEGPLGPSRSLGPLSHSEADTLRDTLVLVLPLPPGEPLDQRWLFFKVWGTLRMPGQSSWTRAFRSLHTRSDVFRGH